jgi:lipoate-protein ligase A
MERIEMGTSWRFINHGTGTGEYNMRFDQELAGMLQEGNGQPTLRLFRWKPWAISLGHNQSGSDIDIGKCARDGIDIVRRPTGGRAILHAEELTYSIVLFAGRRGVLQIYNEISSALVRGLDLFGVKASLQRSQPNFSEHYKHPSSIPCFTSSARYEIEWKGRKLVGSAQRRYHDGDREVVLQHGSILCGPAHRRLADYILADDDAIPAELERDLREKTTDLEEIRGGAVDLNELSQSIKHGFELEWGTRFTSETMSHSTEHSTAHV